MEDSKKAFLTGLAVGVAGLAIITRLSSAKPTKYTSADQVARFAAQKKCNNRRVLDIASVFNGKHSEFFKGKRVVVTGANRGIGLGLAKELVALGAKVIGVCRKPSAELEEANVAQIVQGIDVTKDDCMKTLVFALGGQAVDVLINNAGYFYEPLETIDTLNFAEELKMIDICAVGPLRVTAALFNAGLLKKDSRVAMITSQGGSISWRDVQNPEGHDYGHHMSKAAANMMGKLLSQELKHKGVIVTNLHPGFCRTDMTSKYSHIWDIEGAVPVPEGAKRVLLEIALMNMADTGRLVNCEDGLDIPW